MSNKSEKIYFVLEGNEFGLEVPDELNLCTLEEAKKKYNELIFEDASALLICKIENNIIKHIKTYTDF